jgi:acylphosphatase
MQWYRFVSHGKVQHVFYRKFVSQKMMRAGFNGYVRNLDDGTVETAVFIMDEETDIPRVLKILEEGSPMSEVEKITYAPVEDVSMAADGFEIRY